MNITDLELEALRKFNSGKNADAFTNTLDPGTYPVKLTVTLEGELRKGHPGLTKRRDVSGSSNLVRYLLDRINDNTYERMLKDLTQIRSGKFDLKQPDEFSRRLESIMPYVEFPRAGSTKFAGTVYVEDVVNDPTVDDLPSGLKLVEGGK